MGNNTYSATSLEEMKEVEVQKEKKNQNFTREQVIEIVNRIAFFISDNGIFEDGNGVEWLNDYYPEND